MITNEWILGNGDLSVPLSIRHKVFIEEHKMDAEPDADEMDALAMHLVLYDDGNPIASGRLYHDGKAFRIGRCCVLGEYRGQGVGDLLVKLLLLKAFGFNPSEVRINAREPVAAFYERYGFAKTGAPFPEAGQAHIPMAVTKDTLAFPSKCGKTKGFYDLFTEAKPKEP